MAGHEEVNRNLERWLKQAKDATMEIAEYGATEAENTAKAKGRWTDQTSQARNELQGDARWDGEDAVITLYHGAEHGLFLELAHGRKYAVIEEALRPAFIHAHRLWKRMFS